MNRWYQKTAIVTGAASGFGQAISEALVKNGVKVVGIDLNGEPIKQNAEKWKNLPGQLFFHKTDVTSETEVIKAFDWAEENVGAIHILVNCAGVVYPTTLIDGSVDLLKRTLEVNLLSICITTQQAIRRMRAKGIDGHIVQIDSIVGHHLFYIEGFDINIYPASKAGVVALNESFRQELNAINSAIKVTNISPSFVNTNIVKDFPEDHTVHEAMRRTILKVEDVANGVIYMLSTPPEVLVPTLIIRSIKENF